MASGRLPDRVIFGINHFRSKARRGPMPFGANRAHYVLAGARQIDDVRRRVAEGQFAQHGSLRRRICGRPPAAVKSVAVPLDIKFVNAVRFADFLP